MTALRDAAIAEFARLGFPTTKHEEWKYTSLRSLATVVHACIPAGATDIDAQSELYMTAYCQPDCQVTSWCW
ncbi:MAG: hypothetical protein U0176_21135 [Bacteroidia bacterium]